jgi:DNA relaxase NicK
VFPALLSELIGRGIRFNVKRLDLAFDDVPFSPQEFLDALQSEDLNSVAKRETIRVDSSPRARAEDASHVGTTTVYIGANTSERMVRVYDKRGPVRLEFQLRDKQAHAVAVDIFRKPYPDWEMCAKGHLRQYLDFENKDWWRLFTHMAVRKDLHISSARVVSFARLEGWLEKQVSVALSVWFDVQGDSAVDTFRGMLRRARKRNRVRYGALLELSDDDSTNNEGDD